MKLPWKFAVLLCTVLVLSAACKPDELPDPDPDPDPAPDTTLTTEEADALLGSLSLYGDSMLTEGLPSSPDLSILLMNGEDTFFTVSGIRMPIRIKHPADQTISGFRVGIRNGSFHYDVPVTEEYDGDTVSVIFIEVLPDLIPPGEELPLHLPLEIIAYDEQKEPIDKLTRIFTVEEPNLPGCSIAIPPTTDSAWMYTWWSTLSWSTVSVNRDFSFTNYPGKPFVTETTIEGCCDPTQPNGRCNPLSTTLNATVNFKGVYVINTEDLTFYTDGTYVRKTEEVKRNFDPSSTNFCAGIAGFSTLRERVDYTGTHNVVGPGVSELVLGAGTSSCDLCGYGFTGGTLICTNHVFVIERDRRMIDGTVAYRVYIRNDAEVNEWHYAWYD